MHNASGDTPQDYLYDQAEEVRRGLGFVDVKYQGEWYKFQRESWAPLDGDLNKLTVLIRTKANKWVKLWYFDKDDQTIEVVIETKHGSQD